MCGIAGIISTRVLTGEQEVSLNRALQTMKYRGPDNTGIFKSESVILGHNRLSIIDIDKSANQPMISSDNNYVLVFNGEIFNFQEIKKSIQEEGVIFKTQSDTEVLLHLLIRKGKECLSELNGFFALAFYSKKDHTLLLARDRFGEKPLKYFWDNGTLYFSSETKSLKLLSGQKKLSRESLSLYFQFNYIPAPYTILENCFKVMPGECITFKNGTIEKQNYQATQNSNFESSESTHNALRTLLHDAVKIRMISDVPLGSFLSGGIDSTIISGIAREYDSNLNTFSIGFPEEKHFDETEYALKAAQHIGSKHEVIPVQSENLLQNFDDFIDRMDEPFADSSAIAVFELCKQTKSKITVALSGDGADELFGGYHKHMAHLKANKRNFSNTIIKNSSSILNKTKGSRNSNTGNKIRQLKKYAEILNLSPVERYLRLASIQNESNTKKLLSPSGSFSKTSEILHAYIDQLNFSENLSVILKIDQQLVLANDMLVKTDLMSMANSLEVRPPFLDYRIVDFANGISDNLKINKGSKKYILKTTFKEYIPNELLDRPKKGFEVPLHRWFNQNWKKEIQSNWLNNEKIQSQNLFSLDSIDKLKSDVFSSSPGDSPSTIWAMIIFQEWIQRNDIEI